MSGAGKKGKSNKLDEPREALPQFKALILELNKMLPDIAELELRHNSEACLRVKRDLAAFRKGSLAEFENLIKAFRQTDVGRNIQGPIIK